MFPERRFQQPISNESPSKKRGYFSTILLLVMILPIAYDLWLVFTYMFVPSFFRVFGFIDIVDEYALISFFCSTLLFVITYYLVATQAWAGTRSPLAELMERFIEWLKARDARAAPVLLAIFSSIGISHYLIASKINATADIFQVFATALIIAIYIFVWNRILGFLEKEPSFWKVATVSGTLMFTYMALVSIDGSVADVLRSLMPSVNFS